MCKKCVLVKGLSSESLIFFPTQLMLMPRVHCVPLLLLHLDPSTISSTSSSSSLVRVDRSIAAPIIGRTKETDGRTVLLASPSGKRPQHGRRERQKQQDQPREDRGREGGREEEVVRFRLIKVQISDPLLSFSFATSGW